MELGTRQTEPEEVKAAREAKEQAEQEEHEPEPDSYYISTIYTTK